MLPVEARPATTLETCPLPVGVLPMGPQPEANPEHMKETCHWPNGHNLRRHAIPCEAQDIVVLVRDVLTPPDRLWDPMSLEATCMHGTVSTMRSLHYDSTAPCMEDLDFESVHFSDVAPTVGLAGSWGPDPPSDVEAPIGDSCTPHVASVESPSLETALMHATLEAAQEVGLVQGIAMVHAAPFVTLTRGSEVGSMAEGVIPTSPTSFAQLLVKELPSLVCLQETKLHVINDYNVMQILGSGFDYSYLPTDDTRGGILVAWHSATWTVSSTSSLTRSLSRLHITKPGGVVAHYGLWPG
jgi:hypothetical protein